MKQKWQIVWTKDGPRLEPHDCDSPWDCVCIEREDITEDEMCGYSLADAKKEIGEYWKDKGQTILDMSDEEFERHEGYGYELENNDD